MNIGLVRHFKVDLAYPERKWISRDDLIRWLEEYDHAAVIPSEVDRGSIDWHACYSSDLPRAVATAKAYYSGAINTRKELREAVPAPFTKRNIRLPSALWGLIGRITFSLSLKPLNETRSDVISRVNKALDEIINSGKENILIVSHGALMVFLRKELINRGFAAPVYTLAENGRLYIFEKKSKAR